MFGIIPGDCLSLRIINEMADSSSTYTSRVYVEFLYKYVFLLNVMIVTYDDVKYVFLLNVLMEDQYVLILKYRLI